MTQQTLESRVEALEKAVAELLRDRATAAKAQQRPWEVEREPMTPEEEEAFNAMVEYGRYFRKTGRSAPHDWKPGDPIPEPDYDE